MNIEKFLLTGTACLMTACLTAALPGCGGNVVVDGFGAGGSGGAPNGGSGGSTTVDPAGGTGGTGGTTIPTTTIGSGPALAIHTLRLGDITQDGQISPKAWRQYGFNLDGVISDPTSTGLCKPASNAKPSTIYDDGDEGKDNSFGRNIMPIFTSLQTDLSAQVNDAINMGQFTVIYVLDGITPGQTGPVPSGAYGAAFLQSSIPKWSGADVWTARSDSVFNNNLQTPIAAFPGAQVTADGTGSRIWYSGLADSLRVQLLLAGYSFTLVIHSPRVTMLLSDDNTKAKGGQIGGYIHAEELIDEIAKVAGSFDPNLCPPSATFDSIAEQFRQAQDIPKDGMQDPNKECDAISIGLGFDAEAAELSGVFDVPVMPDPCF